MATCRPEEPDRYQPTGVYLTLFGDPRFEIELYRAPDSGGSPGSWALLASLAAGTMSHRDTLPKTGAIYWYKARHVASGYDPGAYTNSVSTKATELPADSPALSAVSLQLTTPLAAHLGGSGQASYELGDLLYASGTYALARRAIGAAGDFLKVVGGVPVWAAHGLTYTDVGAAASGHDHSGVYSPVGHAHAASDITSAVLAVVRGGTGLGTYNYGSILFGTITNSLGELNRNVTTTRKFLQEHGDTVDITELTWSALIAADLPSHTHVYSDLTGVAASSHNHPTTDLTSGTLGASRGGTGIIQANITAASLIVGATAAGGGWIQLSPGDLGTDCRYLRVTGTPATATWVSYIQLGNDLVGTFAPLAGSSNIVTVGALNAGSITSGFGAINIGADALTCGSVTASGLVLTPAPTASGAGFRLPVGTASPSSPVEGDVWIDDHSSLAVLYVRIGGVTKTVVLA